VEFAQHSANVVLLARSADKLRALERELAPLPGVRLVVPADIRLPEQVESALATALERFGHIDVLVNCAGIGMARAVTDTKLDDLRDVFETNFFGAFNILRAVARHMIQRRSGFIIEMSSVNGFCPVPLGSAYVASKFALEGLARTARAELRSHNVDMLIVRPGLTDTEFFDKAKHFRESDPFPMERMMSPRSVARKTVQAAARGRREIVLGREGKFLWWLSKLSPQLVDWIIAAATDRYRAKRAAAKARPLRRSWLSASLRGQTTAPSTDRTGAPSPQNAPAPDRAPRPAAK
jgi:short-subunit dehydrogenase